MKQSIRKIAAFSPVLFPLLLSSQGLKKDTLEYKQIIQSVLNPKIIEYPKKISELPEAKDTLISIQAFEYGIHPRKVETSFRVVPIQPARMTGEPLQKLKRFLVKGGFGTYSTSYGEVFINSLRSKEYLSGLHLKHLASSSTLAGSGFSGFSGNEAELFAKKFYNKHTLGSTLEYDRDVVHYYGYDPSLYSKFDLKTAFTRQVFNYLHPTVNLKSHFSDSSKINHDLSLSYSNLTDIFKNAENNVAGKVRLSSYYEKELIQVDASAAYYNYRMKKDTFNNILVGLSPSVISSGKKFRAQVGLSAYLDKDDERTRFRFYPSIYAQYDIIDHIIIPYAGVRGDLKKNSYKSLSDINPFINPYLTSYANTDEKIDLYGGFKGTLSKNTSFDAGLSWMRIDDSPFFLTDVSESLKNRFRVVYDDVKRIHVRGELAHHYNEKLQVLAKGDYFHYETDSLVRAWYSPEYKITLSGLYNLRDKIIAHADVFIIGKQLAPEIINISGDKVSTAGIVELRGLADINLGLEYRYSKFISAFINFCNIGSYRYYRWANYPSQRFRILAGASLSF